MFGKREGDGKRYWKETDRIKKGCGEGEVGEKRERERELREKGV